jgi:hypothetical protein
MNHGKVGDGATHSLGCNHEWEYPHLYGFKKNRLEDRKCKICGTMQMIDYHDPDWTNSHWVTVEKDVI